ncbi:hypothetical protein ABH926_003044 [Catenulispora sp. GP43]|uniref:TetR-like C-terminal domain-containing protein n=1 Tax=Catenulispora sp. GP43 TaxID=3156263 RepID=UPI00351114C7
MSQQTENVRVRRTRKLLREALIDCTVDDTTPPPERWAAFFEHIDACHRFYGAMLGRKGSPWFADRMRAALSAMVTAHVPASETGVVPASETDLVPAVLGAMFTQSITWWLDAGRPVPPREIAATSARLAGAVIREAGRGSGRGDRPR